MGRPNASSRLSFRRDSTTSIPKSELVENEKDKARNALRTKADPTKAVREPQPSDIAAGAQTTLGMSIRQMQHRDSDGNPIADPDRSNPTRPRLERPLDTVRSFEAAIDGSFQRRQSMNRDSTSTPIPPRRMSYNNNYSSQRRQHYDTNSYYGGSPYGGRSAGESRPGSYHDYPNGQSNGMYGSQSRRFGPSSRNNSDPALYGNNSNGQYGAYQQHGQHQSYDTLGTSNGSYSTDQWGNSTDPSSENSSLDRMQTALAKGDYGDGYGMNSYGPNSQFEAPIPEDQVYENHRPSERQQYNNYRAHNRYQSQGMNGTHQPQQSVPRNFDMPGDDYEDGYRPSVPPKTVAQFGGYDNPPPPPPDSEKRRSWLKKRFSRG